MNNSSNSATRSPFLESSTEGDSPATPYSETDNGAEFGIKRHIAAPLQVCNWEQFLTAEELDETAAMLFGQTLINCSVLLEESPASKKLDSESLPAGHAHKMQHPK